MVEASFQISGIGPTLMARNGEGDPYYTDGEIDVARLVRDGVKRMEPPTILPPPALIALKDQVWHSISLMWLPNENRATRHAAAVPCRRFALY